VLLFIGQTVVQTDWSGGGGVCAPVSSWGNTYCSASPEIFHLFAGKLRLKGVFKSLDEYLVDSTIGGWDNDPDIVDMDGDGDNDLLVSDEAGPMVIYWYENDGCGSFTRHTIDPYIRSVDEVVAFDYQRDGDMDVCAVAWPYEDVILYVNDGAMNFSPVVIDPDMGGTREAEGVDAGDIDGDGDNDIAATGLDGALWWYENTGSGWSGHNLGTGLGTSFDVVIGDYDGDGDNDIAMATYGALRLFVNLGGGTFSQIVIDGSLSGGYGLTKGDMDGDGDYDLVLTDITGKVFLYRNDGGLVFSRITVDSAATRPMGIQVADFEPDGDLDIAVADQYAQRIYIYLNDGSLNFTKTVPPITPRHYFGVGIGDLNSDASPDILVRAGTFTAKEGLWWYKTVLRYYPFGTLTSSPYDAGVYRLWQEVEVRFSNCNPGGTEIHLYVRASRYGIVWTDWIGPYVFTGSDIRSLADPSVPGADTFAVQRFRYIQYRVDLYASSDSTLSPILDEIRFIYDPLGDGDELGVSERTTAGGRLLLKGRDLEAFGFPGILTLYSSDGRKVAEGDGSLKVRLNRGIYYLRLNGRPLKAILIR